MADPVPVKIKDLNLRGWKFFLLWIVSLSLSTFLTSSINSKMAAYEKQKETISLELKRLKDEIRNLIYADENIYLFCSENRNVAIQDLDNSKLDQINNDRNDKLRALVNDATSLYDENKIDDLTYNAIAMIATWNQKLFLAGSKVCRQKLKSPIELALWKKDILKIMNKK